LKIPVYEKLSEFFDWSAERGETELKSLKKAVELASQFK
jgi:hypothetical protein